MNNQQLITYWNTRHITTDVTDSKKYYRGLNTKIDSRKMIYMVDNQELEDTDKPNEKIATKDMATMVDQLTGYLLSDMPTIEDYEGEYPQETLWATAKDALKQCQIQAVAWVRPMIDKNDNLKFRVAKFTENIIPIYNENEELIKIIYYYTVPTVNDTGTFDDVTWYEIWDDKVVEYWIKTDAGYIMANAEDPDNELIENPETHITKLLKYTGGDKKITDRNSWGQVPFIPVQFNDENMTMLEMIGKTKIDALDYLMSDGCNNFLAMADAITIIEGFSGNPDDALKALRAKKVVGVKEGGGVSTLTTEIPMVSREAMIKILLREIYKSGQGVNLDDLKGSSLTNEVLKAHFELLNIKSNNVMPRITKLYNKMLEFVAIKESGYNESTAKEFDGNIKVKYSKAMIINETNKIKSANESVGNLSEETRLAMYPNVDDPKKEMDRMQAEEIGTYEDGEDNVEIIEDTTTV